MASMLLKNQAEPKKRKIEDEKRVFNENWTEKYFFIEQNNKALCLICRDFVPVFKNYNLKRHYIQKHSTKYDVYLGICRRDKIAELKKDLSSEQIFFKKAATRNDNIVKASYVIANLIAKKSKPFIDGEFIKECMENVANIICPEKKLDFSKISLSHQTIATRIEELGNSVENSLKSKCINFKFYSLAMDESTDASDTAQLAIFIRGIDENYNIMEEMAALVSLKDTTKSVDLFDALKMTMKRFSLCMKNLSAIITDGAPAMVGKNGGLVKMVNNEAVAAGNTILMTYHCIVHQGNLCGKILKMENVLNVVVKTINFIRAKGLNHRQFQEFLKVIGTEFADVIYYTEVRWLSKGKMLKRFYHLRTEIKIFMETKGKSVPEFEDEGWVLDLAFLVDLTEHLNDLNLRLQGKNQFINNMFQTITAFERKLKFWHNQIKVKDLTHFSTLAAHEPVSCTKYAALIFDLIQEFESRFQDFRKNEEYFNIFATPFSLEINKLPWNLQMECIDLQSDMQLKEKFGNVSLLDFYKDCLPRDKYPNFHNHALFMSSAFGSTYICEQLFSRMKHTKNKNRTKITDKHLENALRIATSSIELDIDLLVQQKQIHPSH